MIPEIANFRKKYPQYEDVGDSQLAGMLAQKYPDAYGDLPGKLSPTMQMQPSHSPVETMENPADTWRGTASRLARPALEGGGAAVGSIVGAGAGLASGPGAPAASPLLALAGGSLGYAGGKRAADILDETLGLRQPKDLANTAAETVSDLGTGAMLEMGGQFIGPSLVAVKDGGKWVAGKAGDAAGKIFTKKGAERVAGQTLQANTSQGPIYAKNAEEAAEIEKAIPGLKFSQGQRSNDPNIIKLERTQMRRPGSGADMSLEQTAKNNEALRAYYEKTFAGKEGLDDVVTNLRGQQQGFQQGVEGAQSAVQGQAGRLSAADPTVTGQKVVDVLSEGKSAVKGQAKELYDAVPPMNVPADEMLDDFARISQPMSRFEEPGNVPGILKTVQDAFEEGTERAMSLNDMQGLRSELLAQSRTARSSQVPNERLASRLDQAARAVEKAIKSAEGPEGAGAALGQANKFFREEYSQVFNQGTVGNIMRRGPRGEQTRTPLGEIPSKIWTTSNLSAADDFVKAAPNEAPSIMRDHAAYDLLYGPRKVVDEAGNIVTGKLNGWMTKNRQLLKRFGIEGDFDSITKAQRAVDAAGKAAGDFEKTVAARMLNSDPEKAVAAAFSGRNSGAEAAKLMQMVAKDPAAKRGLQKAFADHLMTTIQTTAKDVAGNPIISNAAFQRTWQKYAPVMRVLYKDEPKKIAALNTMRRAYEISTRNARSPIGGGSDTAENFLTELAKTNVLSRTATIAKGFFKALSKHGDDKVNEMVNRALFDPDYAQTLINASRGKIPEKELQGVIDGKIIQLIDYRKARESARAAGMSGAIMGANGDAD